VAFLALGGALLRPMRAGAADARHARAGGALARLATSE
jgi:hypothetical protein